MQITKKIQAGFTLIELMIVVAIIGILASIAIPQYEAFIQRSEFKVMETAVAPYKLGVEMCAQEQSTAALPLVGCNSPRLGRLGDIPPATVTLTRNDEVDAVSAADGIISATSEANAFGQLLPTTYILTPMIEGAAVVWYFHDDPTIPGGIATAVPGNCVAARLCR